jgi:hypothetical protein
MKNRKSKTARKSKKNGTRRKSRKGGQVTSIRQFSANYPQIGML